MKLNWIFLFVICVFMFFVTFYLCYLYPNRVIGPQQPIYFSHRVHAGVKDINCRFCHPFVERSEKPGIPDMEKCFFCHRYIITQHPQIEKLKKYYDTKTPVPWVRINNVPDFVRFNHECHIKKKIDCIECHGDVKIMDRLKPAVFEMGFCVECHKSRKAQLDCWMACHK